MSQELLLSKGDVVLDLGALLAGAEIGASALAGITGLGIPAVAGSWFEGAGDGAVWRGSRVLARDLDVPILLDGGSADQVQALLSRVATILSPKTGLARLTLVRDGERWFADVARVSGGDWSSGTTSDGERWVATLLSLRAGDPFWTREDASSFEVKVSTAGRGLLPKLASMRLTSSQAMGSRTVENPGDAEAYPVWEIVGPGSNFTATSASGEVLRWEGTLAIGETLTIDTQAGTVVDGTGVNRYDKMSAAPRFWSIEPGTSAVSVTLDGATTDSRITASWRPRRWVSF